MIIGRVLRCLLLVAVCVLLSAGYCAAEEAEASQWAGDIFAGYTSISGNTDQKGKEALVQYRLEGAYTDIGIKEEQTHRYDKEDDEAVPAEKSHAQDEREPYQSRSFNCPDYRRPHCVPELDRYSHGKQDEGNAQGEQAEPYVLTASSEGCVR